MDKIHLIPIAFVSTFAFVMFLAISQNWNEFMTGLHSSTIAVVILITLVGACVAVWSALGIVSDWKFDLDK